jgi:CheY-like chemotaxis protein
VIKPDIYRVLPDQDGWIVRQESGGRLVDRAFTKEIAIESARRRARGSMYGTVIVHGTDGSIESEYEYKRPARASPGAGQKVLVIDDDDDLRRTVSAILRVGGYKAVEAAGGEEAMTLLAREKCDLIITDLYMPRPDGVETIQRIREADRSIPIIAMSGAATDQVSPLDDAMLMGATRTLAKPFYPEDLLAMVTELVRPS